MDDAWPLGSVVSMGTLRVRVEGEVGSTHEELWSRRRWVEAGTGLAAESQTAGVGRSGARWESPRGGIYLSIVAGAGMPAADVDALGQAASLSVMQMASEVAPGAQLFLKWPNDVVARLPRDRIGKVAGVIVRAESDATHVQRAVVSVGVNLQSAIEQVKSVEGPAVPTSLETLARRAGDKWTAWRAQALEWLVGFLALNLERARVEPLSIRARYGGELRKSPLRARIPGVKEVFRPVGVVQGGSLQVRREDGRTAEVGVEDAERLEWRWLRDVAAKRKGRAPRKGGRKKRAGKRPATKAKSRPRAKRPPKRSGAGGARSGARR